MNSVALPMPVRRAPEAGFTLIEVLAATLIFGLAVFAIVQSRTVSLRNVVESERLFEALELAGAKMAELELKYQKDIDKNGVSSSFTKENGTFEKPFEGYIWTSELAENSVKLGSSDIAKLLTELGVDPEEAQAQADDPVQKIVLNNLNKVVKENLAELTVMVKWKQFGREMKVPLVTHLSPKNPKIEITLTGEQ